MATATAADAVGLVGVAAVAAAPGVMATGVAAGVGVPEFVAAPVTGACGAVVGELDGGGTLRRSVSWLPAGGVSAATAGATTVARTVWPRATCSEGGAAGADNDCDCAGVGVPGSGGGTGVPAARSAP